MFCKTFLWKLTTAVRDVSALMGLINFSSDTKNKNNLSLNCWNLSNFTLCEVFRLRSWTRVFNFLQNCKRKSLGSERKRKSMQWQSSVEETSWKRPQTKTLFFFLLHNCQSELFFIYKGDKFWVRPEILQIKLLGWTLYRPGLKNGFETYQKSPQYLVIMTLQKKQFLLFVFFGGGGGGIFFMNCGEAVETGDSQ